MKSIIESTEALLAEQEAIPTRIVEAQQEQQAAVREGEAGIAKHANARSREAFLTERQETIKHDLLVKASDLRYALEEHYKSKLGNESATRSQSADALETALVKAGFSPAPPFKHSALKADAQDRSIAAVAVVFGAGGRNTVFEITSDQLRQCACASREAVTQLENLGRHDLRALLDRARQVSLED